MIASSPEQEDTQIYKVVSNHEEQYSIWPDYKEIPRGWKPVGETGSKTECLSYIKEVWTDMRPLSLREAMDAFSRNPPPLPLPDLNAPRARALVDRLCEGEHAVEVGLQPEKTVPLFKEAIDRDFVHIKFTETSGGTELGFRLDRTNSNFTDADFANEKGTAHLEGTLTLDYVKVNCVADINLASLEGKGHLVKVETRSMAAD